MLGNIYKITNKTNNKVYIGQTARSINERFGEHLRDAFNRGSEQPLYRAIRKYGKDNFEVELVESCHVSQIAEREAYWVEQYDSYNSGYNATLGGDGKPVRNYQEVSDDFMKSNMSMRKYSQENNMKEVTLRNALRATGKLDEYKKKHPQMNSRFNPVSVNMLDKKTGKVIETFESINQAINYLGETRNNGRIRAVCTGQRQSAYGYGWSYAS